MKKGLLLAGILITVFCSYAQPKTYTVANAHSHNDYEQQTPFWLAYEQGFGSIEADVFLRENTLPVAHNEKEIRPDRTLKSLYLDPLRNCIRKNKGSVYANPAKKLNLLIDCKTEGVATLNEIIRELKEYPDVINNKGIRIVITGNQPNKDSLSGYPSFIGFDGDLTFHYTKENLAKVVLFSANFSDYARWKGAGVPDAASATALKQQISYAHKLGKPIRFWGAPDTADAWKAFENLKVDYINTDQIAALSQYLQAQ